MPVTATPYSCVLKMVVQTGTKDNGDPVLGARSYKDVRTNAVDDDVYAVSSAIAGLQSHPVISIQRLNEVELEQEA